MGLLSCGVRGESPFATEVVDYSPAPGQFVGALLPEASSFTNAGLAVGAPVGGGAFLPDQSSVVSLGAFGGSITLAFDHTVEDHPLNPFGMDAIVFSNAHFFLDDQRRFAEVAVIEISRDENGNGLADDAWFVIPGSHLPTPGDAFTVKTWDDDIGDATYPPAFADWIPAGRSGIWTTEGFQLPNIPFAGDAFRTVVNPATEAGVEGIFGYAEYSPTLLLGDTDGDGSVDDGSILPEAFYTKPDDPFVVGMTPGSGGGDAFDIAWAVDPVTGLPAELDGFDFIRLTTAVDQLTNPGPADLGEMSSEIDAVSDVAPDPFGDFDGDGDIDMVDVAGMQGCLGEIVPVPPGGSACDVLDRQPDGWIDLVDFEAQVLRMTGPR